MGKKHRQNSAAPFVAGILAWLIPGAGHVYLRRTLRGVILCLCINGLFWSGVLIGGVFTVEPVRRPWWFLAQICTGISGGAAWYRQERFSQWVAEKAGLDSPPGKPVNEAGLERSKAYKQVLVENNLHLVYHTEPVARTYTGIAGMLNLLCIFDAVMLALLGRTKQDEEHQT